MNTIPIQSRAARRALLVKRYRSLRVSGAAVLSLLTVRAINAETNREASRLAARITKEHAQDRAAVEDENALAARGTTETHGITFASYRLAPAERAALAADLGRAARALVTVKAVLVTEEPIPAGYVPASVAAYVPILIVDPEGEAQAAREAAAEIAEIERNAAAADFDSDLDSHPVDYSPTVLDAPAPAPVKVAAPRPQNFAAFLAASGMLAAL